jgi:hypothetical protein
MISNNLENMTYDKSISKDEQMLKIFEDVHDSPIKASEDHKFFDEGDDNPVQDNS